MRPIVTERVAWSVGLSVCPTSEPCKNGCTDRDAVWVQDSSGPKEPCIRCGSRSPWEGAILRGNGRPIVKYEHSAVICVKNGWTDRDAVWVMGSYGP